MPCWRMPCVRLASPSDEETHERFPLDPYVSLVRRRFVERQVDVVQAAPLRVFGFDMRAGTDAVYLPREFRSARNLSFPCEQRKFDG